MIVDGTSLRATVLGGLVRATASEAVSLEGLFLGGTGQPDWEELKRIGPLCFDTIGAEPSSEEPCPEFSRDFGDSEVRCRSGAAAVAEILPHHKERDPLRIPAALGFAFAQQWARHGHACVHGALLRVADTGVLVVGQRAVGKSVLSASALAAGGAIVSDDFLLAGFASGKLVGERIRQFLSLRRSWAARSLRETFTDAWTNNRNGSRAFLRIPDGDARFPESSSIDRVWVLGRPKAGRRETSTLAPVGQAELYAAIVAAIQPLLLGADFPYERERLGAIVTHLVASTPAARIETGQDIVLEPAVTWQRLLAKSA